MSAAIAFAPAIDWFSPRMGRVYLADLLGVTLPPLRPVLVPPPRPDPPDERRRKIAANPSAALPTRPAKPVVCGFLWCWAAGLRRALAEERAVITPPVRTITARHRGSRDAPEWTRHAPALGRWFEGRASSLDLAQAIRHERKALEHMPSPWPSERSRRHREEREKPEPPPPTFTPDELERAAAMIEKRCAKSQALAERAWIELRSPPRRCKPADALELRVQRAVYRAERRLIEDACQSKRRGIEGPIRLGGQTPNGISEDGAERQEIPSDRLWTFGPYGVRGRAALSARVR